MTYEIKVGFAINNFSLNPYKFCKCYIILNQTHILAKWCSNNLLLTRHTAAFLLNFLSARLSQRNELKTLNWKLSESFGIHLNSFTIFPSTFSSSSSSFCNLNFYLLFSAETVWRDFEKSQVLSLLSSCWAFANWKLHLEDILRNKMKSQLRRKIEKLAHFAVFCLFGRWNEFNDWVDNISKSRSLSLSSFSLENV